MNAVVPPLPPDPGLPGAGGLLRGDGGRAVESFLSARGWEMQDARPVQAMYRPGGSLVVRFRVRALHPSGETRLPTLCVESRAEPRRSLSPPEEFAHRYDMTDPIDEGPPYSVWAFPYDPGLKGLTDAAWGPTAKDTIRAFGERPRAVSVRPLNYRPRRRAVFHYHCLHGRGRKDGARRAVYAKVMRTEQARRVLQTAAVISHRKAGVKLSLPIASANENVILFDPLPGTSLRDLILNGGRLPAPERICGLIASIASLDGIDTPSRRHGRPPIEVVSTTRDLFARLAPEVAAETATIVEAVTRGAARDDVARRVVHGDLYEAQVFVADDFSLGLIDLDDVGIGDPALDAANFCAHLLALAMAVPAAKDRILAYRTILRGSFLETLDLSPEAFAWREAFVMLQLATGPFRVLHPRWPQRVAAGVRLAARLVA